MRKNAAVVAMTFVILALGCSSSSSSDSTPVKVCAGGCLCVKGGESACKAVGCPWVGDACVNEAISPIDSGRD